MQLDLELYREHFEVQPGVTISYVDIVPERPLQTFILIHGFGGNSTQWQYQIDTFAQNSHVLAIDLRGHGGSDRPDHGFDMDQLVQDILSILDHALVRQQIVLVGHSFGVAIATEFAVRFPERVGHLVLIAGAGEYAIRAPYRAAFHLPEIILASAQPLVNNFLDASLVSLKHLYQQNMKAWVGWDKFSRLKMPTLIILGNRDQVMPQELYERVAESVPQEHSEILRVDVSAHMVMLERRDAVNRAISRFVEAANVGSRQPRWRTRFETDSRGILLQERPWLAYYEANVPATIHVPLQPIPRLLQRSARRFPSQTAIVFDGIKQSYKTLREEALRFAHGLQALGVSKGSRVMFLLPNSPQIIMAYYGTLEIGAIAVMANPLADEEEIVRQANLVEAEVLVTRVDANFAAADFSSISTVRHIILTSIQDYLPWYRRKQVDANGHIANWTKAATDIQISFWKSFLQQQTAEEVGEKLNPLDTAVIQFTSGTTGLPKGVMLSHENLLANVLQIRAWFGNVGVGNETFLSVIAISHVFGMTTAMNVPISLAATMVLQSRFQVTEFLSAIKKYKPAFVPGVPAIYMAMNNHPNVRRYDVETVHTYLSSGAPLPIEVEEAFEKLTKAQLMESYGMSETSPLTHMAPLNGRDKVGSIGLPLPSTEARIVDLESRRPLPPGQIGELLVRGPQVMQGYWRDNELTSAVIDDLGWLATGDIARMDSDGYFQIISRSQEMWSGSNGEDVIYPRDIEEVIYELPSVEEVVVVLFAGRPVAFVRLKNNAQISNNTIIAYCRRRLPEHQIPRRVILVGEFPRNIIGKVLRRELAEKYEKDVTAGIGGAGQHLKGLRELD
ncbi:MAG: alpha/beta fold hydrolase [Candidatus Promineifilaceae bacterium]|nr:alpha/beta fold hydrolase [Candidatus Promineifilaceae bacterium]